VNQVNGSAPGMPSSQEQGGCADCMNAWLIRALAERLEGRGLNSHLVTYTGGAHGDEHVEEIVVTNPVARERGEVRVGDDGSVTWEYFGKLDDAGVSKILDEITNALRATGLRM
jgi:hypothetical protein